MRLPILLAMAPLAALSGCLSDAAEPPPVPTHTIAIPGRWVFEPPLAEVALGATVTFVNRGGADHTVTFEQLGLDVTLGPGEAWQHAFDEPGRHDYVCKLHPPDMRGAIVVRENRANATA